MSSNIGVGFNPSCCNSAICLYPQIAIYPISAYVSELAIASENAVCTNFGVAHQAVDYDPISDLQRIGADRCVANQGIYCGSPCSLNAAVAGYGAQYSITCGLYAGVADQRVDRGCGTDVQSSSGSYLITCIDCSAYAQSTGTIDDDGSSLAVDAGSLAGCVDVTSYESAIGQAWICPVHGYIWLEYTRVIYGPCAIDVVTHHTCVIVIISDIAANYA